MSYYADAGNYLETQVFTASRTQLVQMLLERACRDLSQALELVNIENEFERVRALPEAIRLVVHAQKIVTELQACLSIVKGGEIAINLARLYDFMLFKMAEATAQRDFRGLVDVQAMLEEILDGWKIVVQKEQETICIPNGEAGCLVA